jgi:hypothetical protein
MASIDTVFAKLTSDPTAWAHVQKELSASNDPRARFVELASEQGLSVDPTELERVLETARRELGEEELDKVSGGVLNVNAVAFNPQPEPPRDFASQKVLIGLLLPAVQKFR